MFARWAPTSFGYRVLFLLHLLTAIVGFGSSFVWPVLSAKARKLDPPQTYAISRVSTEISKPLTTYMIYGVLASGLLVAAVGSPWKFSQTWVWLAIVLTVAAMCLAEFLHTPNIKAMVALQERLVSGQATPTPGGPPAEVLELQERGKRAGMYGGMLHVFFLLVMIDMIWKPGL